MIHKLNPKALVLEPRNIFNKCIIGRTENGIPIYDQQLIIEVLIAEQNYEDEDEAKEHIEYKIIGSIQNQDPKWAPIIVDRIT